MDLGIRQKTISSFGVGPVLAGKGNAFAEPGRELFEQLLQALVQSPVWKGATGKFLFHPFQVLLDRVGIGRIVFRKGLWSVPIRRGKLAIDAVVVAGFTQSANRRFFFVPPGNC